PGPSNVIARCVVDELLEFSGETSVSNAFTFFNAQQIVKCRCFVNQMRDEVEIKDRRNENAKMLGLNELIAQALKEIKAKEAHVDAANNYGWGSGWKSFVIMTSGFL
ncbi:hypothetical protein Tco_0234137, partial [Tanacetum coccineum]